MSQNQKHQSNPSVDRLNRIRIISKRIRGLARLNLIGGDIRHKRLQDYRSELDILKN